MAYTKTEKINFLTQRCGNNPDFWAGLSDNVIDTAVIQGLKFVKQQELPRLRLLKDETQRQIDEITALG